MARVCVGCGLTVNADGLLIVDTVGAWPFSCDQEDLGGGVYCSPVDGALRTAPPALARTVSVFGSRGSEGIADGNTELVDVVEYTLTNPSTCYSARAMVTSEVDAQMVLDAGEAYRLDINSDQYVRFENNGTGQLNTVHWQMSRTLVYTLTPGQVLAVSLPIEITAQGGNITMNLLNWRANGIIVATQ